VVDKEVFQDIHNLDNRISVMEEPIKRVKWNYTMKKEI
jgi:hypothetical protein